MKKLFITILMVSAAILCFGADVSSQINGIQALVSRQNSQSAT